MDVAYVHRIGRQLTPHHPADLATIQSAREKHPNPRVRSRLTVLWYKHLGQTNQLIAELVGYSTRQVLRILQLYANHGLPSVMTFGELGRPTATAEHRERIKRELTEHPVASIDLARRRIVELTGVSLKRSRVRELLHSLGFRWRKTAAIPLPPKKTLEEQIAIQANFLEHTLLPLLSEAQAGLRRVYFVDAAHFVLASQVGHVWCPTRMYVRAASGRQRFNVLGAIDPIDLEFIDVTSANTLASAKYVNSQTVCELLERIRIKHPTEKISLVLDNARYQRNDLVRAKAGELNIELEFLPSYSPNLSLIERVWRLVRAEALPTRHHTHFADFQAAIERTLSQLGGSLRERLSRLLTLKFQTFSGCPLLPT
jgi:transposase